VKKSVKYALLALIPAAILVFAVIRLISAAGPAAQKKQPVPLVQLATPTRMDVTYALEYDGDVLPIRQANIFSRVTGMLEQVYTDMGHTVQRGQLMALIDTSQAHQAELQTAAAFANAKATEHRVQDLAKRNLASEQDLDNAVSALRTAEANYESARIQLSYSKITAPFHGYVTKRWLDPGAIVSSNPVVGNSNTTIFTLMDIDTVRIDINVLDADIAKVAEAKRAIVTLNTLPGREFTAIVARSAQAINTVTRTMPVEILIPNRDQAIKPGSFAHVRLVLGEHPQALTVPPESVLKDSTGSYVLTVNDSIAIRKPITPGVIENGRMEVQDGLADNDRVIVIGQNFAKPKGKVHVVAATSSHS
jgi:membrane fusion protein, multidrug efflux system